MRAAAWQPRRVFRDDALSELTASIRERGVLQPLWVRERDGEFELIAGERRLRAARAAGLAEVPVQVLDVDDRQALELALVENLQREDLDPIEEAEGYRALAETFDLTQEQIAERVGRARASVANALRLLSLPDFVKTALSDGQLSAGHAKALLGLHHPNAQSGVARRAIKEGWSVRDTERAVVRLNRPARPARAAREEVPEGHTQFLADQLRQRLGTRVSVQSPKTFANGRKAPGSVRIEYYGSEDLDRLMELLGLTDAL